MKTMFYNIYIFAIGNWEVLMAEVRIRTNKLKNNMVVSRDTYARNGVILVKKNTVVDQDVISILVHHFIDEVYIKIENTPFDEQRGVTRNNKDSQHFKEFGKQFKIVEEDIEQTLDDIIFKDENIDVGSLIHMLNSVLERTSGSMDLRDMIFYMKETSDGLYGHSLNVALIAQLIAGWMQLPKDEIELIGAAGLLHDIGKVKMAPAIVKKEGKLTPAERAELKKHAIIGYNIVKEKSIDHKIKQTVLTHHERLDGSGYPLKIDSKSITKIPRIIAVADTYDLMTSKQSGQDMACPFDVIHNFEINGYGKYDPNVMMAFLSNILNNFIHYKVLLNDGQAGEICFINKSELSRPLLKCGGSFIDLTLRRDLKIVKLLTEEGKKV